MEKSTESFVYNARKRRRTIRVFKVNRIVALSLLVTIVLAGVITFFAIKKNKLLGVDSIGFYFIEMGQFTSSGDAALKSSQINSSGGAGYVINDGIFRVMATVFRQKSDAETVLEKISSSGRECSIYYTKTKKFNIPNYDSKEETKRVRELLFAPSERIFDGIQSQDIMLDGGQTTDSAALLAISSIKNELLLAHDEVKSFLSRYPADKTLNALEKVYSSILASFDDYVVKGELNVGTGLKSILCVIAESTTHYFKNI